jgi:putative endonuclease
VPVGQPTSRARLAPASRRSESNRRLGLTGEDRAAEHLQRLGFEVIARNVRSRLGEIDLVAYGRDTIVFVEVKTVCTSSRAATTPLERLSAHQRARLRRLAAAWLADPTVQRPRAGTIRFDAVGVLLDKDGALARLDHVEAAW